MNDRSCPAALQHMCAFQTDSCLILALYRGHRFGHMDPTGYWAVSALWVRGVSVIRQDNCTILVAGVPTDENCQWAELHNYSKEYYPPFPMGGAHVIRCQSLPYMSPCNRKRMYACMDGVCVMLAVHVLRPCNRQVHVCIQAKLFGFMSCDMYVTCG